MRIGLFLSSMTCCLFADVQNEGLLFQALILEVLLIFKIRHLI